MRFTTCLGLAVTVARGGFDAATQQMIEHFDDAPSTPPGCFELSVSSCGCWPAHRRRMRA
jgi:hypothetical protein